MWRRPVRWALGGRSRAAGAQPGPGGLQMRPRGASVPSRVWPSCTHPAPSPEAGVDAKTLEHWALPWNLHSLSREAQTR